MATPNGFSVLASRIRSGLARCHADRALRIATRVWGDAAFAGLDEHAIAADDAAFLAESAARGGRHDEAREHARQARQEYLVVRELVGQ